MYNETMRIELLEEECWWGGAVQDVRARRPSSSSVGLIFLQKDWNHAVFLICSFCKGFII